MSRKKTRTSGALPWRPGEDGRPEVLLVHRRRHDDWSIPKGKAEPGESEQRCALRETYEETGLDCRLEAELPSIRYEDRRHRLKTVRYWSAEVEGGAFKTSDEIDAARWLSLPAALATLTEPRERPVVLGLASQLAGRPDLAAPDIGRERMLILIRGAKAWTGSAIDGLASNGPGANGDPAPGDPAPGDGEAAGELDDEGRRSAQALTVLGSIFDIERVLSSPVPRCVGTVAPLAEHRSLDVEVTDLLAEDRLAGALELISEARGTGTVLCTHESILAGVIARLVHADETRLDKRFRVRKGAAWVLAGDATRYRSAYYLPLPVSAVAPEAAA